MEHPYHEEKYRHKSAAALQVNRHSPHFVGMSFAIPLGMLLDYS